jgi:D-psicose/D-tagatose/L-ribulose 3-epimerase
MKTGFNLLLWTTHVTDEHTAILKGIKKAGYDTVEIPVFEGTPEHFARLGDLLDKLGLERSVVSVIGPSEKNPLSSDKAARAAAVDYTKWVIDCTNALGAKTIVGPMHSEIGYFSGNGPTAAEIKRGVSFHRKVGDYAAKHDVRFAVEAINRFECYFVNTMQQLADYLDEVDHPAIKGMYDTFHANIEEKDPITAIKTIKKHMIHVHISENDRGTPGKGHVPWEATYKALRAAKYDGWLTIEAFGRALPALAAATRVWRDFFPSQESVYIEGLKQMKTGWARAK